MGTWEFIIIILLCILLLKPHDIKILTRNVSNIIISTNKYINSIKENIIKSIDLDKK